MERSGPALCLLAFLLPLTLPAGAHGAPPWPYMQPPSAAAACHAGKYNIKAPVTCSVDTCSAVPVTWSTAPPLQINTSTAAACCEACRSYVPAHPTVYGGRPCNAWTWCQGKPRAPPAVGFMAATGLAGFLASGYLGLADHLRLTCRPVMYVCTREERLSIEPTYFSRCACVLLAQARHSNTCVRACRPRGMRARPQVRAKELLAQVHRARTPTCQPAALAGEGRPGRLAVRHAVQGRGEGLLAARPPGAHG